MKRFILILMASLLCFVSCSKATDAPTKINSYIPNDDSNNENQNNNNDEQNNQENNQNNEENQNNNNENENGNQNNNNQNEENQNNNENNGENNNQNNENTGGENNEDDPINTEPIIHHEKQDDWIKLTKVSQSEFKLENIYAILGQRQDDNLKKYFYYFALTENDYNNNIFIDFKNIVVCTNRIKDYGDYVYTKDYMDFNTNSNDDWQYSYYNYINSSLINENLYVYRKVNKVENGNWNFQFILSKCLSRYVQLVTRNLELYFSPNDSTLYIFGSLEDEEDVEYYDVQDSWVKFYNINNDWSTYRLDVSNATYEEMIIDDKTIPRVPSFNLQNEKCYIKGFVMCASEKYNYNEYVYKVFPFIELAPDSVYPNLETKYIFPTLEEETFGFRIQSYKDKIVIITDVLRPEDIGYGQGDYYRHFDVYYDSQTSMLYFYRK